MPIISFEPSSTPTPSPLYEYSGQLDKAQESYARVARSNPAYEMGLNASINALLLESRLSKNYAPAREALYKMADQLKNEEFRDRIYFALANSYLQEGDTVHAITNLRLSAGYNMGNQTLLSEAYLKTAGLYFELPQYPASYAYYDSTLTLLPEADRRLEQVQFRHTGLKDLTTHFTTIEREDSLQRLARLSDQELDAFIEALIENERQSQLNQSVGTSDDPGMGFDPVFTNSMRSQLNRPTDNEGKWYFYNPTTVSLGKMEFERKWGRRAAEDNWRRSDKSSQTSQSDMQQPTMPGEPGENLPGLAEEVQGQLTGQRPTTNLPTKENLLANVPKSPEQLAQSQEMLAQAYFRAGMIFLDYFNDPAKAIEMFGALISAYPQHALAEQALFWSAMAYKETGNEAGRERMKQQLLASFPDGRYAPFLRDPEHAHNLIAAEKALQQGYQNAFNAYQNNQFNEALALTADIKNKSEKDELIRKAHLLSAVSYGKLGNNSGFESELNTLVTNHAETAEGRMAAQWLAMIEEGLQPAIGPVATSPDKPATELAEGTTGATSDQPASAFTYEPGMEHQIFVVVNNLA
ncbi:MAG: hypothetical protein LC643_02650, partial [Bacteroidales bacterium]|nr:hypothetical protein [Bacteroidales bacterium]